MKTLIITFCLIASQAYAQFDPSCYFPEIGNGIDTVYGSKNEQRLGSVMYKFPPTKTNPHGSIVFSGHPDNPQYLSSVSASPPFNIKNMIKNAKKLNFMIDEDIQFGHFRDRSHIDLLVKSKWPRIYWSDDNGEFDSSRYTDLRPNKIAQWTYTHGTGSSVKYSAPLTSDSVVDIIMMIAVRDSMPYKFQAYFMLFRGGWDSINSRIRYADTAYELDNTTWNSLSYFRYVQGDFRGTGREDVIVGDPSGNWFFYRNDPPFSLERFAKAIYEDTLLAVWENQEHPLFSKITIQTMTIGHFLPKPLWDKSVDFMTVGWDVASGTRKNNVQMVFSGGIDFGSKRLLLSDMKEALHSPWYYSESMFEVVFSGSLDVVGDIAKTGGDALLNLNGVPGNYINMWYLTGKAIDDKIDMYYAYSTQGGESSVVPFDANGDGYEDVLISDDGFTTAADVNQGKSNVGTIHLVYGSKKIPVTLNPKYAVEEQNRLRTTQMYAYPNPCMTSTTLTFENCTKGELTMDVFDVLGNRILREVVPDVENGIQQYSVNLTSFAEGMYYVRLYCPRDGWQAATTVVKVITN